MTRFRRQPLFFFLALSALGACDLYVEPDESADPGSEEDPAAVEICSRDREWTLTASGSQLVAFEGARVWVSAVEPAPLTDPAGDVAVTLLEDRVSGGGFSVACEDGLSTSYAYPSVAVIIDADGSDGCSADDVYYVGQYYGWASDLAFAFTDESVEDWTGAGGFYGQPWPVIGETTTWGERPLCDYYVAAP